MKCRFISNCLCLTKSAIAFLLAVNMALDVRAASVSVPVPMGQESMLPYRFTGVINGNCSGAVVSDSKIVISAAHCVYNPATQTWKLSDNYWLQGFNEETLPDLEQEGKILPAYLQITSYSGLANQDYEDKTNPSRETFSQDFVVFFSNENLSGAGAANVVLDGVSALSSENLKLITGYPIGLYRDAPSAVERRLHQTGPFSTPFYTYRNENAGVFEAMSIIDVSTGPGNSGGPVWTQYDDDWYYSGVLVGGRATRLGYSIDSSTVCAMTETKWKYVLNAISFTTDDLSNTSMPALTAPSDVAVVENQTLQASVDLYDHYWITSYSAASFEFRWEIQLRSSGKWMELVDGSNISGTRSTALNVSRTTHEWHGAQLRCVAIDSNGVYHSKPARITVFADNQPPFVTEDDIKPNEIWRVGDGNGTFGFENGVFTMKVFAKDNVGVESVTWQNSNGGTGSAIKIPSPLVTFPGGDPWLAAIPLIPGFNVITFVATDFAGNRKSIVFHFLYDTTSGLDPHELGAVTLNGATRWIKANSTHAFVAEADGVAIVRHDGSGSPIREGTIPIRLNGSFGSKANFAVDGTVFVGQGVRNGDVSAKTGVYLYDVSDPAHPVFKSKVMSPTFGTLMYDNPLGAHNDYLYVVNRDIYGSAVSVFNIANPANPQHLNDIPLAVYSPFFENLVKIHSNRLFIAGEDTSDGAESIQIFSLAQPDAPAAIGLARRPVDIPDSGSVTALDVSGNFAWFGRNPGGNASVYDKGVVRFDFSELSNIRVKYFWANYIPSVSVINLRARDDILFILDSVEGFTAWDVSSLDPPVSVSTGEIDAGSALNFEIAGNKLLIVESGKLIVYDLAGAPAMISVTSPAVEPHVTSSPTVTITGTSASPGGISVVNWYRNGGATQTASGREAWVISGAELEPGENFFNINATDNDGRLAHTVFQVDRHVAPSVSFSGGVAQVEEGQSLDLAADVVGFPDPDLRWEYSIDGQTAWALVADESELGVTSHERMTILNADASVHDGYFRLSATSVAGSSSDTVLVRVTPRVLPPLVTRSPDDVTAEIGDAVVFSVGVSGSAPFEFQWHHDSTPIDGATEGMFSIASVRPEHAGRYGARVSNQLGSDYSYTALLKVNAPPPTLVLNSSSQNVGAGGGNHDLSVTSNSQWSWSDNADWISSAESSSQNNNQQFSYTVDENTDTSPRTGVITFTSVGIIRTHTVTQDGAGMSVSPSISAQPINVSRPVGDVGLFTIAATGSPDPEYQWQVQVNGTWVDLPESSPYFGVRTRVLIVAIISTNLHGTRFQCVVGNGIGAPVISDTVELMVVSPARIIRQPMPVTGQVGDAATMSVEATGYPAPSYWWEKNEGSGWFGFSGTNFTGDLTRQLTIKSLTCEMNGWQFRCVADNGLDEHSRSDAVSVTVLEDTDLQVIKGPKSTKVFLRPLESFEIDQDETITRSVEFADLDGDGALDLVSVKSGSILLRYNNQTALPFLGVDAVPIASSLTKAMDCAVGDVTADGLLDVVVAQEGARNLLLVQGPPGMFTKHDMASASRKTQRIKLIDLNLDGRLDAVIACDDELARYYLNQGANPWFGDISENTLNDSDARHWSLATADVNGDGFPDVCLGTVASGKGSGKGITCYLNRASDNPEDSPFGGVVPTPISGALDVRDLQLLDLNGDGWNDLIAGVYSAGGEGRVFLNSQSHPFFASDRAFGIGSKIASETRRIRAVSMSATGVFEVFFARNGTDSVHRYLVTSEGAISGVGQKTFGGNTGTYAVAVGDINGDGILDVAHGKLTSTHDRYFLVNSVEFSAEAKGRGTVRYQWSKKGNIIQGATNSVHAIYWPGSNDEGAYSLNISDNHTSVNTVDAFLTAVSSRLSYRRASSRDIPNLGYRIIADLVPGRSYSVQWSKDLSSWTTLTTVEKPQTAYQFLDENARFETRRFYRIIEGVNPVP
jgi:hypothetical protein